MFCDVVFFNFLITCFHSRGAEIELTISAWKEPCLYNSRPTPPQSTPPLYAYRLPSFHRELCISLVTYQLGPGRVKQFRLLLAVTSLFESSAL